MENTANGKYRNIENNEDTPTENNYVRYVENFQIT